MAGGCGDHEGGATAASNWGAHGRWRAKGKRGTVIPEREIKRFEPARHLFGP